jgi:hypothetical protein
VRLEFTFHGFICFYMFFTLYFLTQLLTLFGLPPEVFLPLGDFLVPAAL